jgi:hypothetical protein
MSPSPEPASKTAEAPEETGQRHMTSLPKQQITQETK